MFFFFPAPFFIVNNIGDPGVSSLSSALKVNSSLTLLNLYSIDLFYLRNATLLCFCFVIMNSFGEKGASSLSEALKVNSSLTHLDIGETFFSNGVEIVFSLLHKEQHSRFWSIFIIRGTQGQFSTHSFELGRQYFKDLLFSFKTVFEVQHWRFRSICFIRCIQS